MSRNLQIGLVDRPLDARDFRLDVPVVKGGLLLVQDLLQRVDILGVYHSISVDVGICVLFLVEKDLSV